jgi:phage I-like protein
VKKFKFALVVVALAGSSMAMAQDKSAMVKQFLDLQRPGIEALARGLVEQSSAPIAQAGSQYLQTQVPAEKREAAAKAADAELKKYFDDAYPLVRDKAVALAPDALGPILRDNFSEEELRQLLAWINSPLSKKYQELNPKMQTALTEKLVAETRSSIEPKMRTLDANVAKALGAPTEGATPAKSAPKAPAKK